MVAVSSERVSETTGTTIGVQPDLRASPHLKERVRRPHGARKTEGPENFAHYLQWQVAFIIGNTLWNVRKRKRFPPLFSVIPNDCSRLSDLRSLQVEARSGATCVLITWIKTPFKRTTSMNMDQHAARSDVQRSLRANNSVVLALACLLSGCTASVHPLLTEKELVEQADLSGMWEMELTGPDKKRERVLLEFEKYDTSTYDVYLRSEGDATEKQENGDRTDWPEAWTVQVGQIEEHFFAQMIPRDLPIGPPLVHGIPVYVFGRIELKANTIKYFALNDVNCASLADQENLRHISYEPSTFVELTVFTTSTKELQKAAISHADKAFNPKPFILRRVRVDANKPR